jgi:hypothetical protein
MNHKSDVYEDLIGLRLVNKSGITSLWPEFTIEPKLELHIPNTQSWIITHLAGFYFLEIELISK